MGVLFISHSSNDNAHAIRVRDWLKSNGWGEVFLDLDPAQGLAPGQRWQEELKRAGENCSAVIVLISPNWAASVWCRTEFLLADQLGKRVFPILIAPTPSDQIPIELRGKFQIADLTTPEKETEGFERFAIGLKRAGLDPKSFEWPPPLEPDRAVYRGLQPLDVQDAAIFFGRDAAITGGLDELRRLRDDARHRILVILGASGAGKSSFLRAGIVARLKRDEEDFVVLPVLRPEHAVITGRLGLQAALSMVLARDITISCAGDLANAFAEVRRPIVERLNRNAEAAGEQHTAKPPTIILPIDQTEELFGAENAEASAFCEMLDTAIAQDGNVIVVATIRSDSYEPLQTEPHLAAMGQVLLNLPPITASSFKDIIEGPAHLVKPPLKIESALTQQLLADVGTTDALPLLAFTLERLHREHGQAGHLTLSHYQGELNGLGGAIQSAIHEAFGASPTDEQFARARRLFIPALVQVDADGVKRRIARWTEIPADTISLANDFVAQRLLVRDDERLEISHEAILRAWPKLADWIADEHKSLVTLDSVRAAARDWSKFGGSKSGRRGDSWLVHRAERLREARKLLKRRDFAAALDADALAYLAACRRRERNAVVGVLHAAAIIFVVFAVSLTLGMLVGNGEPETGAPGTALTVPEYHDSTGDEAAPSLPSPAQLDIGGPANPDTLALYSGTFEALGLSPYWFVRTFEANASFQFEDLGQAEQVGERSIRAGGMRVAYTSNQTEMTLVVIYRRCGLMNGVTTSYEAVAEINGTVLKGCARRGHTSGWPLGERGSEDWGIPRTDLETYD